MSQYTYPTKNKDHTAMIGWDDGLQTYFLHVIDETIVEDEEGRDVKWIGATPYEIHDLNLLIREAQLHGHVSEDLERQLYRDANA